MNKYVVIFVCAAFLAGCDSDDSSTWLNEHYARNVDLAEQDADVMVRYGLVANRKHRYIDLLGTASGAAAGAPNRVRRPGPRDSRGRPS